MLTGNYQSENNKVFYDNASILSKLSNKASQEDGATGHFVLLLHMFSLLSWAFHYSSTHLGKCVEALLHCFQPGGLLKNQEAAAHAVPRILHPAEHLWQRPGSSFVVWVSNYFFTASCKNKGKDVGSEQLLAGSETTKCGEILLFIYSFLNSDAKNFSLWNYVFHGELYLLYTLHFSRLWNSLVTVKANQRNKTKIKVWIKPLSLDGIYF